jgi:hypothetical protein
MVEADAFPGPETMPDALIEQVGRGQFGAGSQLQRQPRRCGPGALRVGQGRAPAGEAALALLGLDLVLLPERRKRLDDGGT